MSAMVVHATALRDAHVCACRYCPVEVRKRAIKLLAYIAPKGSWMRGALRRCARLAQPKDWPHLLMVWLRGIWESCLGLYATVCGLLSRLFQRRPQTHAA
jgi:hypothetical protein